MRPLTWLHLSDWHQNNENIKRDRRVVRDKLLEDVTKRQQIDGHFSDIQFVFFSGDIAKFGAPAEFALARDLLIDPLKSILGSQAQFVFCPGNHDVDRGATRGIASELATNLWKAAQDGPGPLSDLLDSPEAMLKLKKPLANYYAFCNAAGQPYADNDLFYAHKHVADCGRKVGIVAFDTAWAGGQHEITNVVCAGSTKATVSDYGHLLLSEKQLLDGIDAVKDCDYKIALMHHPYYWLSEADQIICEQSLFKEFDLVLHGHEHRPRLNRLQSTFGEVVVVPAGACFSSRFEKDSRYSNAYNFGYLDLEKGSGKVFQRVWSNNHGCWVADDRHLLNGFAQFEVPGKRGALSAVELNVLNDAKQRLVPYAKKRLASFVDVDYRSSPLEVSGQEILSVDVAQVVHLPAGRQTEPFQIKTLRNERLARVQSEKVKSLFYRVNYLKFNNIEQDLAPLRDGKSAKFEIGGGVTEISYGHSTLETNDGIWIHRLNRFAERLRVTIHKSPKHVYEFAYLGGLETKQGPQLSERNGGYCMEWSGLLFPGEGLLVQWYLNEG
jgi:3',5'-cyclic AMP phosphodiesterase CpdA